MGFLLSAKTRSNGKREDVKEFTKGTMFSWAMGVEVNTNAGIDLGLRYLIGLTDINDAKDILDVSYKLSTPISLKSSGVGMMRESVTCAFMSRPL